jgi:outer membrane protein OmpA-like peptidoglycan-associated protein
MTNYCCARQTGLGLAFLLLSAVFCHGQKNAVQYDHYTAYFPSGKSTLSAKTKATLKSAFAAWQQQPGSFIELTGHTDALGPEEDNDSLSEQRLQAVKQSLIAMGIPEGDMFSVAFGELKPVASNDRATGRHKNRRVDIRLYTVNLKPMLSGTIIDRKDNKPLPFAEIVITAGEQEIKTFTNEEGRYQVEVPEDTDLRIEVFSEGYFFKTSTVRAGEESLDIPLAPAEEGAVFPFENMNFEGNLPVLVKASERELPVLLKFMQKNPGIHIEVAGHINGIMYPVGGEPRDKFQLSVDRARVVHDYLVENGISAERMTYNGYGNRQMIYPSPYATFEQQAENRRVEIRILKVKK